MQSDTRVIFRENLRALMKARDIPNPYQLSIYLTGKGVPVSQRTIAYALDKDDARYANLSTLEAVAAGFGMQAWQLLVPDMDPANPPRLATRATEVMPAPAMPDAPKRAARRKEATS